MFNISMHRVTMQTTLRILREKTEEIERTTFAENASPIVFPDEYHDMHIAVDDIIAGCVESPWCNKVADLVDTLRYPLCIKWVHICTVTQDAADKYGTAILMFDIETNWVEKDLGNLPHELVDFATYETDTECGNILYIRI